MSYKTCKYGCNTQIVWNSKLSKFVESDGTVHERDRCESLRPRTSYSSPHTTTPPVQPAPITKTMTQESYDILSANQLEIIGKLDRLINEVKAVSTTVYAMQQDLIKCVKWIQAQTAAELHELESDRRREDPEDFT